MIIMLAMTGDEKIPDIFFRGLGAGKSKHFSV